MGKDGLVRTIELTVGFDNAEDAQRALKYFARMNQYDASVGGNHSTCSLGITTKDPQQTSRRIRSLDKSNFIVDYYDNPAKDMLLNIKQIEKNIKQERKSRDGLFGTDNPGYKIKSYMDELEGCKAKISTYREERQITNRVIGVLNKQYKRYAKTNQ